VFLELVYRGSCLLDMDVDEGGYALARLVGFSKVIPTSAESQRQWLQYKKNGGSPSVFMVDIRPSADSGGSDGTTIKVFLQDGHRKQFRAHLRKTKSEESDELPTTTYLFFSPLTLALGTSNRQFGQ